MGLEDLEKAGLLRAREEWGKSEPETGVSKRLLLLAAAATLASILLMYVGSGGHLTWIGLLLFLASLAGFTWLSLAGIRRGR